MQRLVHRLQPAFERRYAALHAAGDGAGAAAELAGFTARVVAQARMGGGMSCCAFEG